MTEHFDLIHVGKCGGSSVRAELLRRRVPHTHVHMVTKPTFSPSRSYVILVRDPVDRFVSCFNWRRYLLTSGLRPVPAHPVAAYRQAREYELFEMFADVNEVGEALEGDGANALGDLLCLVGHVRKGFSWYLDELLDRVSPHQIRGVIATPTIADDFQRVFGFELSMHKNGGYPAPPAELSARARSNIEDYLSREYATLRRLKRVAPLVARRLSFV